MQKIMLKNGLKVLYEEKNGNAVVIQVLVNVGSNDETPAERGISHFLEHILFEGTKKRPTNEIISNEIEKIGGDFNAYTTNERTCYYIKVLKKHFPKAIEILSDILQNSIFNEEHIQKEKNIVLKEIDMVNDEPSYYQWVLLQRNLFTRHPAKNSTYGNRTVIKNLTRKQVLDYFHKYYQPNNMIISIVGDVPKWEEEITKKFVIPAGKVIARKKFFEPKQTKIKVKKERRDIANTRMILAFKTFPRNHPDSNVLEVINGILGRGQSGRMFIEIRGKRGLAYEVGTHNINEIGFGYFAVFAAINRKNVKKVETIMLQEINKLLKLTQNDLEESKTFIEGDYLLELEEVQKRADQLLFWEQLGDAKKIKEFLPKVKKVTRADVRRVVKKYFKNHTLVVLEGR